MAVASGHEHDQVRVGKVLLGQAARQHVADSRLREHGLGLDALTGFVEGRPLWQIHQAVFAVLALESEAVDPRL